MSAIVKLYYFRYVMLLVENLASGSGSDALGNVAALRTFRVLRALKTVAVVPGKMIRCI